MPGKLELAKRVIETAKDELNKEREENYRRRAKQLLEEIDTAKRTVDLLEKQLRNFMREIELHN
jgi:hypothetical protein